MKQIPILFSTMMVKAILARRKTKTRRMVKGTALEWLEPGMFSPGYVADPDNDLCQYGKAGDLLYVREMHYRFGRWVEDEGKFTKTGKQKWFFVATTEEVKYCDNAPEQYRIYRNKKNPDEPAWHKRSGLFMPKCASRIWLKIAELRIEHLTDITEADAIAEGVKSKSIDIDGDQQIRYYGYLSEIFWLETAISSFKSLWQKINGESSYDENPWVWVISLEVLSTTGKPADI